MYILFITRGYPSEKYKMNGIFEFDQARALAKAGHKVVYAAVDMRSARRPRKWGFESFEKDGVRVEAVNIPCGRIPDGILYSISAKALEALYRKIEAKHGRPDVMHAHFIFQGYIAARCFSDSRTPLVLTEHYSELVKDKVGQKLMEIGRLTYPRMDRVITVGGRLAESLKEKFGVEATVVPNIVDTSSFAYSERRGAREGFSFVSIGSLIPRKRMDLLIEAFGKAFGEDRSATLTIFGDGPEMPRLQKLVQEEGLSERVLLMGLKSRKEIAKKLGESDCFVLASAAETFGVVYIEAMAVGLPVIATRSGGPEDFVDESCGVVVPADDLDALAGAMRDMRLSIGKYDRKSIAEYARSRFSPETVAAKLADIYKEVLKR